jgi:hypothetical protein
MTAYTQALAVERPKQASSWIKSIRDPELRLSAIESVMRYWKRVDPDAAQDWFVKLN